MVLKIESLKANISRELDGDWIDYPAWGDPDVAFKVSSFNKQEYQTASSVAMRRLSQQLKGQTPTKVQINAALGAAIVDHILHDWKGLDVPFSREYARELLSSEAGYHIVDAVDWCARQVASLQVEFEERSAKNSGQLSAGKSKASIPASG